MDTEMTKEQESTVAKTPAEGEEEKLIPVIKYGPWPVQYKSRIPYDFNYYGDFYFASIAHRGERVKAINKARSGAACDKSGETDDRIVKNQRQGFFRFTDLPAEIRKLIFQLIASTILCFDPKSKTYYNHVIIGLGILWKYRYELCYGAGVEKFLEETSRSKPDLSPEEKARLRSEFVKRANDYVYIHQHHPNRDGNYLRVADEEESSRSTGNTWGAKLDWAYLEWIRGLANSALFSFAEGEGLLKILTNIRDLKVTKGFQVEIKGYTELDEDGYGLFRKAVQQFNFMWEPKIREALLPDVLRLQIPKTDRNHYLASRAGQ
ncbi:hypothetical protein BOTNAR_0179g00110 [Botryotinia narcissicola]|uniref:Uncharacterized protein n=1 Tax=Botryotinia narcissicola TaxID=278944 RepID=A0A4Z1IAC4_9HELO|nr:hypothetical protein BOTNAR_0179g00110 [Botryotinia narcissicola]